MLKIDALSVHEENPEPFILVIIKDKADNRVHENRGEHRVKTFALDYAKTIF